MPSEQDRNIEASLKAYAEKRRSEAGDPRMPPAMRRQLEAEVRRQFSRSGSESSASNWFQILLASWPRLAVASAIVLVLGLGLWSIQDRRTETQFAQQKLKEDAANDAFQPPTSAPAPVALAPVAEKNLAKVEAGAAPTLATVDESISVDALAPGARSGKRVVGTSASPLPGDAGTQTYFRNVAMVTAEASSIQAGRAQARPAVTSSRDAETVTSSVLSSFQLEQVGSTVRLVDADGSVYEGQVSGTASQPVAVEPAVAEAPAQLQRRLLLAQQPAAPRAESPEAQLRSQSQAGYNLDFAAFGTNRSLQQAVAVTGSLVMAFTNQLQAGSTIQSRGASTGQLQDEALSRSRVPAGPVTNSLSARQQVLRVIGTARLGGTNELLINAVPESK